MSSREQGRGSARNRAPESAVLATISSADAIVADARGSDARAVVLALPQRQARRCFLMDQCADAIHRTNSQWFELKCQAGSLLQLR
jgi:hypothetical protein